MPSGFCLRILLAVAAMAIATQTHAQPESNSGRYSLFKTEDGFVRFDGRTGAVAICRRAAEAWACSPVPDEARRLKDEVDTLEARNKELERENKMLKDELAALDGGRRPEDQERPGGGPSFRLPSEQEVDKALDYFEGILKKFRDRLDRLERETTRPKDPAKPGSPGNDAPRPPAGSTPKKEL